MEEKTMNKKSKSIMVLKILYIINDATLLPCAYLTVLNFLSAYTDVPWPWSRFFLGLTLPVVMLRCFNLPYIQSAVIAIVYLCLLIKNKFPLKDTVIFVVLLIICILGLLSVEEVFWAAMGV